jgi:hypothetical protein
MSDPWYIPLYKDDNKADNELENYGCFLGTSLGKYPIGRFNLIKTLNKLNYTILYDEGDLLIFGSNDTHHMVVAYRKVQRPIMNENELNIIKKVMLKLKIKLIP